MGRVRTLLKDGVQTSTIMKLGRQKKEPTEQQLHTAFMKDFTHEYEKFKGAVATSWIAHNK